MAEPQKFVVIDPNAQAQAQLREEQAELRERGGLDRTAPGGYFLNADGSGAHDAEGRPVGLKSGDSKQAKEVESQHRARTEAQQDAEASPPADMPEEVAERQADLPHVGVVRPWTPPAVQPGSVLSDGSTSQPNNPEKTTGRSGGTRRAKKAKAAKRAKASKASPTDSWGDGTEAG